MRGEKIREQTLRSESKNVFLTSVVHELQTPLAAAKAQAQLALHQLDDDRDEESTARALRVISRQIDRLVRLVGDLLDVNRLEAGQLDLTPGEFDLTALLEEVRTRMQPLADHHRIQVRAPDRLLVFADRDRIDQALTNIVSNAIRYSPEGGEIDVTAENAANEVHIVVRDHGIGVPKEQQQAIFEPFTKAQGGSSRSVGLGLAITKGIVEQHGGTISIESTGVPGEGSTFHVRFPHHRGH